MVHLFTSYLYSNTTGCVSFNLSQIIKLLQPSKKKCRILWDFKPPEKARKETGTRETVIWETCYWSLSLDTEHLRWPQHFFSPEFCVSLSIFLVVSISHLNFYRLTSCDSRSVACDCMYCKQQKLRCFNTSKPLREKGWNWKRRKGTKRRNK